MKFIFIMILVFGGFSAWRFFNAPDLPDVSSASVVSVPPAGASSGLPPVPSAPPVPRLALVIGSYRFLNRPVPSFSVPIPASSMGSESPFFVVDLPTNSWVWRDSEESAFRWSALGRSMDIPASSYEIECVLFRSAANSSLAVDISSLASSLGSGGAAVSVSQGVAVFRNLQTTKEALAYKLSVEASRGAYEVLTSPSGIVEENKPWEVRTGTDTPLPVVSQNGNTQTTGIEYRKSGDGFKCTLSRRSSGVSADVLLESSRLGQIREIAGNEIPEILSDSMTLSGHIEPGKWHLVGGLRSKSASKSAGLFGVSRAKDYKTLNLFFRVRKV